MRSEKKGKVMVYSVFPVIILLIGAGIYHTSVEGQRDIDVDEGYDSITYTVPRKPNDGYESKEFYLNESTKSASATSYINKDEGYLRLQVEPRTWWVASSEPNYNAEILVSIEGEMMSKYDPTALKIEAEVLEAPAIELNHLDWCTSYMEDENGLKSWPPEEMYTGATGGDTCFVGYSVKDNNFSSRGILVDYEHPSNYSLAQDPITLQFKAILMGIEKDVEATTELTFTQKGV